MDYTSANCPSQSSEIYYLIITLLASPLNALLIFLIKYHTHELMKPYKRVLYTSASIDFCSSLFQFITQTRPSLVGDQKILTFSFDGILPKFFDKFELFQGGNLNYAFVPEYWCCYTIVMFTWVPFVYRYLITCWNYQMSNLVYFLVVGFIFFSSLIASLLIIHLSVVSYDTNIKLIPKPDPGCFRYLVQFSQHINGNNEHNRFIYFLWFEIYITSLQWSGLIIVFCAWRLFVFFRSKSHLMQESQKNKSIQFQINLIIFLQAVFPLCVYHLPNKVVKYGAKLKIFEEFLWNAYYKTLYASYSILPVLNALSAILFIQSYRKAVVDYVTRPFRSIYIMSEESFANLVDKLKGTNNSVSTIPDSQML